MSGKNLIVARNPARKRRTSAKQKAAARRNIKKAQAANRRRGRSPRRRSAAKRKRRRNPSASGSYRRPARRRSNPRLRLPTIKGIINDQVIPAAVGGTGAVLDDMMVNLLPIPENFKVGWMRHLTKAIGAIAIGYVGAMFLPKKTADQLGAGAMTVVGYNVVRDLAAQFAPQLPLGEYLPMGAYLDPTLGYYGAGLNPDAIGDIPGAGLETAGQFTRGSPYMGDGLDQWPTGSSYDDLQY